MYLKHIIFVALLLSSNIDKIHSEDESSEESESEEQTTASAGTTPTEGGSSTQKTDTTEETSEETTDETNGKTESTSTEADKTPSDCPKTCDKNNIEKSQSQCTMLKYKISEKAKTLSECIEKCKKYAICSSALFVKPRSVTTLDLITLYNKVVNTENWISLKEPSNLLDYYRQYGRQKSSIGRDNENSDQEKESESDFGDETQKYALVNSSALKSKEVTGFCNIYDDYPNVDEKMQCSSSHMDFNAYEINCVENQECVDKRPRKQCPPGKCGKTCKDYNTIHIPNACMGKYFFGHLEADSLKSCLEFCSSNKNCKSIDFGNMGTCLINYVNRNDTQLVMGCDSKNNEIWDYYELINDSECSYEKPKPSPNEDTCLNVPGICKNGGDCESIQLPPPQQSFSYECNCPCNWCGKHCDKLNMKTFRNGCLNGSALVWSVAESSSDCIDMCLDEIHCKSVSYSTTSGTCVLHWADQQTEPLISSPNCPSYRTDIAEREWTFFEIICNSSTCHSSVEVIEVKELKGCASSPCLNGGECADIYQRGKLIGYHCLCRCGFCGDRCETNNYVLTENACIWKSHISDNPSDYYRKSASLNTCLNFCAAKFPICRSVDFSNKGECLLNNRDSDTAIVTEGCNNYMRQRWALYDLSCVCNNRPVIY